MFLIINIGSTSKRYSLFEGEKQLFYAHFTYKEASSIVAYQAYGHDQKKIMSDDEYIHSAAFFINLLKENNIELKAIVAIGIRVVAPGTYFNQNRLIDESYKKQLRLAYKKSPLHIKPILFELDELPKLVPNIPAIGISDSAFHKNMPEHSKLYALPMQITKSLDIYRFGYHGISIQSIVQKIKNIDACIPKNIIICHLGGGSSITALKDGESFDTSMGFSPLGGVPMATRVGSIGPGALINLARELKQPLHEVQEFLYTKCGMLGLSEQTENMHKLLLLEQQPNKAASRAIELFIYTIKKYIGAYSAALGGLDLIIFTGGIGENSPIIRSRICQGLTAFNLLIDEEKNNSIVGQDGFFESQNSLIKVATMITDEMAQIALEIKKYLENKGYGQNESK